eukprot:SAG31_NODE_15506_length_751_cov_1.397239_2_plen_104_part_00
MAAKAEKGKKGQKNWNQGRGWQTWTNGDGVNRTQAYAIPKWATPGHMEKYYTETEWEQRCKILDDGEAPKDHANLFSKDRWDGKFVCFQCRETGHTMDRCFKL